MEKVIEINEKFSYKVSQQKGNPIVAVERVLKGKIMAHTLFDSRKIDTDQFCSELVEVGKDWRSLLEKYDLVPFQGKA